MAGKYKNLKIEVPKEEDLAPLALKHYGDDKNDDDVSDYEYEQYLDYFESFKVEDEEEAYEGWSRKRN